MPTSPPPHLTACLEHVMKAWAHLLPKQYHPFHINDTLLLSSEPPMRTSLTLPVASGGLTGSKSPWLASSAASSTNRSSPADLPGTCPSPSPRPLLQPDTQPLTAPRRGALQSPEDSGTSDSRSQLPAPPCPSRCPLCTVSSGERERSRLYSEDNLQSLSSRKLRCEQG